MKKICGPTKVGKSDGSGDNVAVASTATVYSRGVNIPYAEAFCLSIRAQVASGTPDVDLYVEQTHVNPDGQTQGAAGDGTTGWGQVEGAAKALDITDTNWHHLTISPAVLPYLRLKAIGQGTNPASCTLEAYIHQLEDLD